MKSEIKPICSMDRIKLADAIPISTPFSMYVFPTTYCNFKCVYCGQSLGYEMMKEKYDFEPENMSIDTYKRVLEQIKMFPNRLKMLSLTGQGEPMINKNLPLMVKLAKEADIAERIEIITNGSLLTREMADGLIEAGLDTLRISLQGLSSEKYKEVCNFDIDFEEFVNNIKYFFKNRMSTKLFVKIIDVALEEGQEEKFYEIFGDCSDRMYIENMLPVYEGVDRTKDIRVDHDRYGRKHNKRKVCPLPFFMLGVFPSGKVEPCDTIYKPIIIGDIHKENLIDMWNGDKMRAFQKMQLEGKRCTNNKCASCCAPDDVSHSQDVLDDDAERILKLY